MLNYKGEISEYTVFEELQIFRDYAQHESKVQKLRSEAEHQDESGSYIS